VTCTWGSKREASSTAPGTLFHKGLRCLHEKIMETDLKKAQLAAARRLNREFDEDTF
jgi:hypothetical protein